jgi:hypothetical protein
VHSNNILRVRSYVFSGWETKFSNNLGSENILAKDCSRDLYISSCNRGWFVRLPCEAGWSRFFLADVDRQVGANPCSVSCINSASKSCHVIAEYVINVFMCSFETEVCCVMTNERNVSP